MNLKPEPMERHGEWFGRKLVLHLLRKFKRKPWLIADMTREQRVLFLAIKRVK